MYPVSISRTWRSRARRDGRHVEETRRFMYTVNIDQHSPKQDQHLPSRKSCRWVKISTDSGAQTIRLSFVRHKYTPHQNDNINKGGRSHRFGQRRRALDNDRNATGKMHGAGLSNVISAQVPEVGHWWRECGVPRFTDTQSEAAKSTECEWRAGERGATDTLPRPS